jgi:hypothetical protein
MRTEEGTHDHETRDPEQGILVRRLAMVGSGIAFTDKTDRTETQGRSPDHQRHHSYAAIGLPLAGLSI